MRNPSRAGPEEVVLQLFGRREPDGMDQNMKLAVALFELREYLIDFSIVRDVALEGFRARQIGD